MDRRVRFWDGIQAGIGLMGLLFGLYVVLVNAHSGGWILFGIAIVNILLGFFVPFSRLSNQKQEEDPINQG